MGIDPPSKSALVEPKWDPALETTFKDKHTFIIYIIDNIYLNTNIQIYKYIYTSTHIYKY